jgi:hypothetical protein
MRPVKAVGESNGLGRGVGPEHSLLGVVNDTAYKKES